MIEIGLNPVSLFSVNPSMIIVGCQPAASPVMFESVKAGRVVEWDSQETLSGEK